MHNDTMIKQNFVKVGAKNEKFTNPSTTAIAHAWAAAGAVAVAMVSNPSWLSGAE